MQNEPLLSVIIPTYNRGRLILNSVTSVLNQTYKNIELIVVDDCSTDNTEEILKSINDSRIKYVKLEKNSGACIARNKGIELSTGKFIAFNDSDDLWITTKLEKQLCFLKNYNADIVICKMECRTPENNFIHNFPNIEFDRKISYKDLLKYNSASTQTIFGKTDCFKEIIFDATMPRLQDWDEVLRLSQKYRIFYQNEILVNTFFQKDSISTHPEKAVLAMQKIFEKHKDAILSDPAIVESFFKKKASFVCKTGKNPKEEMKMILKYNPSAGTFIKYMLAVFNLYTLFFKIKNSL
ncbi:glycosyltransferase family 2 protein [Treponema succinifaciens]|uniref:glycosyltransferase family 2 protein n=1 Tax=Treponema succinifaciens TaxID=167 RepID=UPI003FEF082E